MKRIILFILLVTTLTPSVFASVSNQGTGELLRRITNRLVFSENEKAVLGEGVAVVSFTINSEGCIDIIQIDASNEEQKLAVSNKLQGFYIENAPVSTQDTYKIQVRFNQQH